VRVKTRQAGRYDGELGLPRKPRQNEQSASLAAYTAARSGNQ